MKKIVLGFCIVLLIMGSVRVYVMAASSYDIEWYNLSGGGGQVASTDGEYMLSSTIGQPIVGSVGQSGTELCSGFWCRVWSFFNVHLPIIQR